MALLPDWLNRASQIAAPSAHQSTKDERDTARDLRLTGWFALATMLFGFGALFTWAIALADDESMFSARTIGLGLFLLGSAALVGGFLGLLFGIPKSVSDPVATVPLTPQAGNKDTTAPEALKQQLATPQRLSYAVNTNLEQISDWLTKIIVGVALTQIPTIRGEFSSIANYFGAGFATCALDCKVGSVGAAVIMVYGLASGFLAGYLFTRMFLPGAFRRADNEAELRWRNTQLETKITEQQKTAETIGRVQGEIYKELYRYNEQGFRTAIQQLDTLLESDSYKGNPSLWVYLAAAHGQAYRWTKEHQPGSDGELERTKHRNEALRAISEALALGDSWKPILQVMWDPHHPVKKDDQAKEENDLEVFYGDRDFEKLLSDGTPVGAGATWLKS